MKKEHNREKKTMPGTAVLLSILALLHFASASTLSSHSPTIVFAGDSTPVTLHLSGYNLTNITSITLGGNVTCSPQTANYSASTQPCLVTHTRDSICQSISAQYSIIYTNACGINPSRCFNVSNGNAICTSMANPSDQCSQTSCYYPASNACFLYTYKNTVFIFQNGFEGAPCDAYTVCSNTFTCIPNNPPNLCQWDISCQFSSLSLLHNDLVINFGDGTSITQPSALTAVDRPFPVSVGTAALVVSYALALAASPSTPITIIYSPTLASLNATVLLLCNSTDGPFNMASSLPVMALPAGSAIECGVQVTYGAYAWTIVLPGVVVEFEYLPVPTVFSVCPGEILAGIATDVVIQGSFFSNTTGLLTCMFGTDVVPVSYISPQAVVCTIYSFNQTASFVPLTVSNDGVTFASPTVQLKVTGSCDTIKPNSVPRGTECVCQPGYQDMGGFCQLCSDGTYQPSYAQQSCLPCDASEDTSGVLGSVSVGACLCKTGTYRKTPTDAFCSACPAGLRCTQNETISVLPGFWRATADSVILTECHSNSLQCPGGTGYGNTLCAKGYKGPLCSVCRKGYGLLGTACLPCPSKGLNGFVVFVIAGVALAAVYVLVKSTTREESKNDTMGVTIKITFSYLQVLYYEGKLAANWSHRSNEFFSSLIPVTLSPSFLSIQCATEFSFYKNITLMMILPLLIFVAVMLYHILYWVFKMYTAKRDTFFWMDISEDAKKIVLVLLYTAHPTISQDVIRSFQCVDVPGTGTSFMRDDMRIDCSSPSYHRYVIIAALYVVFYIGGFLLYVFACLRINKESVESVNNGMYILEGKTLIFFVRGYWNHSYLWEFVIISRKLGVVIVNALLPPQLQLVWASVIITTSLWLTVIARPFRSVIVGRLEVMSLSALAFTILLGFHGQLMVHPKQVAIFALLVIVNTVVATIMIMAVFRSMKPLILTISDSLTEWINMTKDRFIPPKSREFDTSAIKMNTLPANYKPYVASAQTNQLPAPSQVIDSENDEWQEAEL